MISMFENFCCCKTTSSPSITTYKPNKEFIDQLTIIETWGRSCDLNGVPYCNEGGRFSNLEIHNNLYTITFNQKTKMLRNSDGETNIHMSTFYTISNESKELLAKGSKKSIDLFLQNLFTKNTQKSTPRL